MALKVPTPSLESRVETLLEIVQELLTEVADLREAQEEVIEKLQNLGLPGSDFNLFEE